MILFSHPKPFRPDTTPVQTHAFRSWRKAFPKARILLFGTEEGTEAICRDLGLESAGPVRVEPKSGAALVSDIFRKVQPFREPVSLFLNSDIIVGEEAGAVVQLFRSAPGAWLASGRRRCLAAPCVDPATSWLANPRWGDVTELDYFLLKDFDCGTMPDFVIGHCAWDNWMIWNARQRGIGVADLSAGFAVYHLDHGYEYSRGNASAQKRAGPLEQRNLDLLGGEARRFHLGHATHILNGNGLQRRQGPGVWQREMEVFRLKNPRLEVWIRFLRHLFHPFIRAWEKNTRRCEDWNLSRRESPGVV